MKSMKLVLNRIASVIIAVITTLTLIPTLTAEPPSRHACATPVVEQYGIGHSSSGDIPLKWRAFIPSDGETHPAIIVIHGGGFKGGDFHDTRTDQDLVCAGFCVSTSNIVSRLPENFRDRKATLAVIPSRPMTWPRRFGPLGIQRERRWHLAELTAE